MFTTQFIQGLWNTRHNHPQNRETLRWLIGYLRSKRTVTVKRSGETGTIIQTTKHGWVHVNINGQKRRFRPEELTK